MIHFHCCVVFRCANVPQSVHILLLVNIWRVSSLWLLQIGLLECLSWCPCVLVHGGLRFSCIYTNEWKQMLTCRGLWQAICHTMDTFLNFIMG